MPAQRPCSLALPVEKPLACASGVGWSGGGPSFAEWRGAHRLGWPPALPKCAHDGVRRPNSALGSTGLDKSENSSEQNSPHLLGKRSGGQASPDVCELSAEGTESRLPATGQAPGHAFQRLCCTLVGSLSCQSPSHASGQGPSLPAKRNTPKTQGECAVPGNGTRSLGLCRKRLRLVVPAPPEQSLARKS